LNIWSKGYGNRHALISDINTPHGVIRVFNIHIILLHPDVRMCELELAMMKHDPKRPTIVCGDFNILESPHITPLNLLLGGRVSDVLLYSRERKLVEKRFFEYELHNPLRGRNTHPVSRSQLDHILVSKNFSIKTADVIADRRGSDHRAIRVELA
jgi:endonuclease/exonuclease/phosphatase family metal-dependent hydrolase